jgi:hypothetical protein
MAERDLVAYCGVYGGTCARWCGYPHFRDLASSLLEWLDAQGYQHWMPETVKEFDYLEFRKGLDFFASPDSWLVCHKCCKGGDSYEGCEIRKCCREKGLDLCQDCSDFPCEKARQLPWAVGVKEDMDRLGKEEWLKREIEKARDGFELHTGKYYRRPWSLSK